MEGLGYMMNNSPRGGEAGWEGDGVDGEVWGGGVEDSEGGERGRDSRSTAPVLRTWRPEHNQKYLLCHIHN